MLLSKIIQQINLLVSNNSSFKLSYNRLEFYIQRAVDFINFELYTNYKTPDEVFQNNIKYYNLLYFNNKFVELDIAKLESEHSLLHYPVGSITQNPKNDNMFMICIQGEGTGAIKWDTYTVSTESLKPITECLDKFDYVEMPDSHIRAVLVYYTAASYLEEEDELESQYAQYKSKALEAMSSIKKQYYSCYRAEW